MWPFVKKPAPAAVVPAAAACPTVACATCRNPMPVVAFDQACPRCRTVLKAAKGCAGGCSGCELSTARSKT